MKILVTGGSGFIGSHVVDKLLTRGHRVRVFDLKKPEQKKVDFMRGDINTLKNVNRACRDIDIVYHLASFSNIDLVKTHPLETIETNILGTANLLMASVKNKVKRFILSSSVFVYEINGHIYTTAKMSSERLCQDFYSLYGLPYTILRFSTAYGPRSRRADVISLFVEKALKRKTLIIRGDGRQCRNFIYVEDLAWGCLAALKKVAENKIYTLASPRSISIRQLLEIFRTNFFKEVKVLYQGEREDDYRGTVIGAEQANQELGWDCNVSLSEGIKRYIRWYRQNLH